MPDYVRVTDEVKPRREYSIQTSQVTANHTVLDKPGTYPNGDPLPPKFSPRTTKTTAPSGSAKKSGGQTPAGDKE